MYVCFLRVRKKAFATCHGNLWMYLMAQIPNLSLCPFHGWALQAVTPPPQHQLPECTLEIVTHILTLSGPRLN